MTNEGRSSSKWYVKKSLWTVIIGVLIVIVVLYMLYPESTIKRIKIPGLFEAEFEKLTPEDKIEQIPKAELAQRQEELKKDLSQWEMEMEKIGGQQQPTALHNISGTWQAAGGLSYFIQQSGNIVTVQEISPVYGVTAVGQGVIVGQDIDISYTTIIGTTGRSLLTLSADGRQLTGSFRDDITGASGPIALYR